ncbi:MAG TPA: hypothetical protein VGI45_14005 [Terracidiphilus sp.]|jgi:hypothetical protein
MRLSGSVLVPFLLVPITPAQSVMTSPPRDASAIALAQSSLAAMGGMNLSPGQSVAMTGVLNLAGTSLTSFPIVIKTHGTDRLRSELTIADGVRVTVISGGAGAIRQPDGRTRQLASENVTGYRNQYLPALSLLSEFGLPTTSVENLGPTNVDGSIADVVALGLWSASPAGSAAQTAQTTRTLFYIDRTTRLVLRMQLLHYSENVGGTAKKMEIRFSDYRPVQGIQVPFHQQTYVDGALLINLQLSAVDLNAATTDGDFIIAQ